MDPAAGTFPGRIATVASLIRSELIGRPISAVAVLSMAVAASMVTARRVAVTNSYLSIQHALPTYDGSMGPLFFLFGSGLVALAVLSAYLDAGLLPTVMLAGAPVFGWAINHFSSPISPHYAITFPVEMAMLYGGIFGIAGYLLGAGIRKVAPPPLRARNLLPTVLGLIALFAILFGARFELVSLRPAYDGPIQAVQAGMGNHIGHEEWFLAQLGGLGALAAIASRWWRRAALVTHFVGGVVLVLAGRTVLRQAGAFDLYTGVPIADGATGPVLLGAGAYLFALGGVLLIVAGVAGYVRGTQAKISDDSRVQEHGC